MWSASRNQNKCKPGKYASLTVARRRWRRATVKPSCLAYYDYWLAAAGPCSPPYGAVPITERQHRFSSITKFRWDWIPSQGSPLNRARCNCAATKLRRLLRRGAYSHRLHSVLWQFSYSSSPWPQPLSCWSRLLSFLICFISSISHCWWEWNVRLNIKICEYLWSNKQIWVISRNILV